MPIFIKTEKFKDKALELSNSERKEFLLMHKEWIKNMISSGYYVHSGYLVNDKKIPGGGGLLIIEAKDYLTAKEIVKEDPMIKNELVTWELQEWIPINESQQKLFNYLG